MLHIILMILKILGILILSILGLGFLFGFLVLLCPIRYHLEGSIYGKPQGQVRVSWLLRLVQASFSYQENRGELKISIFGIRLRKRKKKKSNAKQETERERNRKLPKGRKKDQDLETKEIEKENGNGQAIQEQAIEGLQKKEEKKETESKAAEEEKTKKEGTKVLENKEIQERTTQEEKQKESLQEGKQKKSLWQLLRHVISKVRLILAKIKGIPAKIKGVLFSVKAGVQKFFALLSNLNKKKQMVIAFIKDEKNREAFRYVKGRLFRILCHILPGKVTLKLHYGFSDPAATGMLTGMIFMFYPKSAEKFQLMPDFEKSVLEGEIVIKGRVQLIRVLWNLFAVYHHKECKRIIKMIIKR